MFELDFLRFDKIILLLKCIQSDFIRPNHIQMISELKLWQRRLGLMVNFGLAKIKIKRIPFAEKEKKLWEDYSYIKTRMTGSERQLLLRLRDAILFVYECHGKDFKINVPNRWLNPTEKAFTVGFIHPLGILAIRFAA